MTGPEAPRTAAAQPRPAGAGEPEVPRGTSQAPRPAGQAPPPVGAGHGLLLRVLPPGLYAGRARMLLERGLLVYRRLWLIILSGFFEPLFYLFALGTGLGALVGTITGPGGAPIGYAEFIARRAEYERAMVERLGIRLD